MTVSEINTLTRHSQGFITGAGEAKIYYQSWHPDRSPRAVIVGVHGHGDHSGGLNNIIQHLLHQGYTWYGLDLRGHGRSSGQRGHLQNWREYQEDLRAFITWIKMQESNAAIFLLGHSLGGLISLEYALQSPRELNGIVAISPALRCSKLSPFWLKIINIISLIKPKHTIKLQDDYSQLTRDAEIVSILASDPLRHEKITLGLGRELLQAGNRVIAQAHNLQVPLLMLYGRNDMVALADGNRQFFSSVVLADKEYYEYPQSLHRPFDDLNRSEVLDHISAWLARKENTQTSKAAV